MHATRQNGYVDLDIPYPDFERYLLYIHWYLPNLLFHSFSVREVLQHDKYQFHFETAHYHFETSCSIYMICSYSGGSLSQLWKCSDNNLKPGVLKKKGHSVRRPKERVKRLALDKSWPIFQANYKFGHIFDKIPKMIENVDEMLSKKGHSVRDCQKLVVNYPTKGHWVRAKHKMGSMGENKLKKGQCGHASLSPILPRPAHITQQNSSCSHCAVTGQ